MVITPEPSRSFDIPVLGIDNSSEREWVCAGTMPEPVIHIGLAMKIAPKEASKEALWRGMV